MAQNVFGDPITEQTLMGMSEYLNKTTITRTDKAHVALNKKNEAEEAEVFKYMENLKMENSNCCGGVITLGNIYNATGGTITYSGCHDYSGNLNERSTYPVTIENGQWGVFKHEETSGKRTGSCGAVVYSGKNKDGQDCDWMFSWSNPNPTDKNNKVFTEIAEQGHYEPDAIWDIVTEKLSDAGTTSTNKWTSCKSFMTSTHKNDVNNCVDVKARALLDKA